MNLTLLKINNKYLNKNFFRYVIPSVASMWVFSLYSIVDGIFVSKGVSPNALAAVNVSMPFITIIFALGVLFSTGASALISMSLGEKDFDKANNYFTMTIVFVGILSIFISIISLLFLDEICLTLGATPQIFDMVKSYIGIIILFIIFFTISYTLEVLIRAGGYPHLATIGVIISAITNIILDYIFVIKFSWGVEGAALATGIARVFSCTFFILHFLSKKSKIKFSKFKFEFKFIKRISAIGFSDSFTELSIGFVILLFNQYIIKYMGDNGLITYSVISYVNTLVLSTMLGISQGIQPLCSYYLGNSDYKNIKYILRLSLSIVLISSVLIFLGCMMFADYIVIMFIDKSNIKLFNFTINSFKVFSISFLILGFNVITSGFLASLEQTFNACSISLSRGLFVVSISLITITSIFGGNAIWMSTIVSEFIVLILSIILLSKFVKNLDENNLKPKYSEIEAI